MTWESWCKDYTLQIAVRYKRNKEQILDCLFCDSITALLNETYKVFVNGKELVPIEGLEESEKLRLWKISEGYGLKKKQRILICRAVYLLEKLTN